MSQTLVEPTVHAYAVPADIPSSPRGSFAFPSLNPCRICGTTFRNARRRRMHERRQHGGLGR